MRGKGEGTKKNERKYNDRRGRSEKQRVGVEEVITNTGACCMSGDSVRSNHQHGNLLYVK